jgi:hypothetical protein
METEALTHERIAANQSTFREANEKIEAAADRMQLTDSIPFLCECADSRCIELVRMTIGEYETVRLDPRRFFTIPGHERLSVDAGAAVVVEPRNGYMVVDKIGAAAKVAIERYDELR